LEPSPFLLGHDLSHDFCDGRSSSVQSWNTNIGNEWDYFGSSNDKFANHLYGVPPQTNLGIMGDDACLDVSQSSQHLERLVSSYNLYSDNYDCLSMGLEVDDKTWSNSFEPKKMKHSARTKLPIQQQNQMALHPRTHASWPNDSNLVATNSRFSFDLCKENTIQNHLSSINEIWMSQFAPMREQNNFYSTINFSSMGKRHRPIALPQRDYSFRTSLCASNEEVSHDWQNDQWM
jgi:hypothetical protein